METFEFVLIVLTQSRLPGYRRLLIASHPRYPGYIDLLVALVLPSVQEVHLELSLYAASIAPLLFNETRNHHSCTATT